MTKNIKPLTVGDILPHIHFMGDVSFYLSEGDTDVETLYEGSVLNTPWYLLNFELDSFEDGAMEAYINPENKKAVLSIYVKEPEEE